MRRYIASGAVSTGINSIASLWTIGVSLRYLDASEYGLWLVLTAIMAFAQLSNLGLGPAVMKLVAESNGRGDVDQGRRYLAAAISGLVLSGLLAGAVLISFSSDILALMEVKQDLERSGLMLFPWVIAMTIGTFVVRCMSSALSGAGQMDRAQYIQSGARLISLPVLLALLHLGVGLLSLLLAMISALLLEFALLLIALRTRFKGTVLCRFSFSDARRLIELGSYVALGSGFSLLLIPINKLLIARFAGVEYVPTFEIAFTASMQLRAVFESGLRSIVPAVSAASALAADDFSALITKIVGQGLTVVLALAAPVYICAAVVAEPAMRVWLEGNATDVLPHLFRIMLVGSFASLLCVPMFGVLLGSGDARTCMISQALQGIANITIVGLVVFFCDGLTIKAAVVATVSGMIISSVYINTRRAGVFGLALRYAFSKKHDIVN